MLNKNDFVEIVDHGVDTFSIRKSNIIAVNSYNFNDVEYNSNITVLRAAPLTGAKYQDEYNYLFKMSYEELCKQVFK